jgi:hypothetical protein
MTADEPGGHASRRFRSTVIRVFAVQAVAILLLWLLQARYGAG